MNMDSSAHHQNWLGFSLSNHHHDVMHINIPSSSSSSSATSCSSDSSHLCLFEAFTTSTTTTTTTNNSAQAGDTVRATDLSIFTSGGPKLEDFLGGSSTTAPPPPPPPPPAAAVALSQFSSETPTLSGDSGNSVSEIYDSELKSIAAGFLRGFATSSTLEQGNIHNNNKQQLYNNNIQNQELHHHHQNQTLIIQTEHTAAAVAPKKTVDTFGQRTSIYRGVTRHRWTGRYEAHLWDNSCRREGQSRKGRQVYLGGYDKEEKAARAYDLAALRYWGPTTTTNFPVSNYKKELEEMKHMTRQEFVASLRRKSSGFSRGASIYRGVTRHHQHGRWQARIGRVAGNKDLYLGTFSTQEEAAEAYDIAAIKFRGLNAVTNFDMSRYDVKSIANSNLPIGGVSGKPKNSSESAASDGKSMEGSGSDDRDPSSASSVGTFASRLQPPTSTLSFAMPIKQDPSDYWSILGYQNNAKATSKGTLAPSTLFNNGPTVQSRTTLSMDFHANAFANESNSGNNGLLLCNAGGYAQQQQTGGLSSIPFATPIAFNSSVSSSYEGNIGYGSWIAQSLHSFQSAKPNLCVFQTPIFGME